MMENILKGRDEEPCATFALIPHMTAQLTYHTEPLLVVEQVHIEAGVQLDSVSP